MISLVAGGHSATAVMEVSEITETNLSDLEECTFKIVIENENTQSLF
jgi:hypothetical protein